jgi:hypothetical protein
MSDSLGGRDNVPVAFGIALDSLCDRQQKQTSRVPVTVAAESLVVVRYHSFRLHLALVQTLEHLLQPEAVVVKAEGDDGELQDLKEGRRCRGEAA